VEQIQLRIPEQQELSFLGPGDVVAIGAGSPVKSTAATQAPPSDGATQGAPSDNSCAFEGKNYANGEEWALPARYRYKCSNGRIEIIACVTGNGDELKVGQTDTYQGLHRVCEKHGPGVRYIGN